MLKLRMNKKLIFIFTLFSFVNVFASEIDFDKFKRMGEPFYPELYLSENDSLNWPIEFEISLDVKDIKDLNINEQKFFSNLVVSSYSKYDKSFTSESGEKTPLDHQEFFYLETKENDQKKKNSARYFLNNKPQNLKLFYDDFYSKRVEFVQAPFDIQWNMRDYPFDTQKLKFRFTTIVDTSIIKLKPSKIFKSSFNNSMNNLPEGYSLDLFSFDYEYNVDEHDIIQTSPDSFRPLVTESLIFNLEISRSGSWLFIKLFFGGIISFFISLLMFLLPLKKASEEKYAISLGAIFAAVGNKYFIASEISGIQVFTKADLISNLIIFMVVFNMLVMILQTSDKTNFKYFQSTKNTIYFSSIFFIISFLLILII